MDDGTKALVSNSTKDAAPIPVGCSLFDTHTGFDSIHELLEYMLQTYGFFIPFIDFLLDIEGLLLYLGYKIGVGHSCILCHRQFQSTASVQAHMRDKGHCFISLRNSDGEDDMELAAMYYFPNTIDYDYDAQDSEEDGSWDVYGDGDGDEDEDEDEDCDDGYECGDKGPMGVEDATLIREQ
uniref:Zinc finger protein 622 n=1 Tax=Lygus hesperus TaxID=30085 RepID=A0A0A9Y0M0_LYGHE